MKNHILLLSSLGWLLLTGPVLAQDPIQVLSSDADTFFPDIIFFRLLVDGEAPIERVTLIYGTNAQSCQSGGSRQRIEFEDDDQSLFTWEWELGRSGALPPGSTIWWQWQIIDTDGNSLTTERQELIVTDGLHTWQSLSEENITVNWYDGDTAFGRAMLAETRQSLERLESDLGLPLPENVQLWFYPTASEVRAVLINAPEWTGGVAFPEYGITVLSVAPGEEAWAAEIIPHELTHLVEGAFTFNCRGVYLPTWLSEGLAIYAEGPVPLQDAASVEGALANGRLPSLRSLAAGFSAYSDGASMAYTQSGMVTGYLIETYGPEEMTRLLQAIQNGQRIDDALTAVYGFDTDGLDAAWRSALGHAATPTSAALQATLTSVPTRALGGIPLAATPTDTAVSGPTGTATSKATVSPTTVATNPSPTVSATAVAAVATEPVPTQPAPVTESQSEPAVPAWLGYAAAAVLLLLLLGGGLLLRSRWKN